MNLSIYAPASGAPVTLQDLERAEMQIASVLPEIDDVGELEEMRDRFSAIEQYTRKKQLHLPTLGVQRRLEARIGQLTDDVGYHGNHGVNNKIVAEFRILARALNGDVHLDQDEWRQSRRALVDMIREKTKENEPMIEAETISRRGPKLAIPKNMTPEQVARRGMELEASGVTVVEAAEQVKVNRQTYTMIRDVVSIADKTTLSAGDRELARKALADMNETRTIATAWNMLQPIANRLWGETRRARSAKIERNRLEKFEHGFLIIMQTCEAASEIEIPYLDKQRAQEVGSDIDAAIRNLKSLKSRIEDIHR